jgi:hypothetical protein
VVVVVDDWPGTFHIPDGTERQLDPGPRWLVPVGGTLGLLLAVLVLRSEAAPGIVLLVCGPVLLAGVAADRLRVLATRGRDSVVAARGGTRTDGWVVAVEGPPWATDLRVEATDGGDGTWTVTHADVLLPRRPH